MYKAGITVFETGRVEVHSSMMDMLDQTPWTGQEKLDELVSPTWPQTDTSTSQSPSEGAMKGFQRDPNHHRLAARMTTILDALDAARVWHTMKSDIMRANFVSAGGSGNGLVWDETCKRPRQWLPNQHFRIATMMRMQLAVISADQPIMCGNRAKGGDGEETCGCKLDDRMYHSRVCKIGPARVRTHNALARAVAMELRMAGASVDVERHVPELYKINTEGVVMEAIADISVHFPGEGFLTHLDVSVRAAGAERYVAQRGHSRRVAHAAERGESEKLDRYGPQMRPIIIEDGGRLGPESTIVVHDLASRAAMFTKGLCPARPFRAKLVQALRRTLCFEQADAALAMLGSRVRALKGGFVL